MHSNQTGVLVLEPLSDLTEQTILRLEQQKLRDAFKQGQRAIEDGQMGGSVAGPSAATALAEKGSIIGLDAVEDIRMRAADALKAKESQLESMEKKQRKGPKAPNPLSIKKPKKHSQPQKPKPKGSTTQPAKAGEKRKAPEPPAQGTQVQKTTAEPSGDGSNSTHARKRRKRGKGYGGEPPAVSVESEGQ